jgi:hypothetical protein
VWDGRVQRLGYNPYTAIPADPALAKLHTAKREMNNPDLPSPYPAGAQLFFRAITAIDESAFAFKVAFAACHLAIVLLLLADLRRLGRGEHWVLAYASHPLPVTCVAYNGHIDILGVLLLLISVAAFLRRRPTLAAVTFGLAVAVKFLPAVLAPLYWRRVRVRDGLLAGVLIAFAVHTVSTSRPTPLGSLGTFVQRFRFNDPVFAAIERVVRPQAAAGVSVLFGLVTAAWLRGKHSAFSPDAWAWPMAVSLAGAPVIYPWYLLWLVPFLQSASTLPLMIGTLVSSRFSSSGIRSRSDDSGEFPAGSCCWNTDRSRRLSPSSPFVGDSDGILQVESLDTNRNFGVRFRALLWVLTQCYQWRVTL